MGNIGEITQSGWKQNISIPSTGVVTSVASIELDAGTYSITVALNGESADLGYVTLDSAIQDTFSFQRASMVTCIVVLKKAATASVAARSWTECTISGYINALRIK